MVFSAKDQILIKVWPANSPDLNLVDYRIWGKLQECLYTATGFMTWID